MRLQLILIVCFINYQLSAQCITFTLTTKGDTLNCTEANGNKRGKWKIHVNPLRGNPGYEEEGEYANNKKEGLWRRYNFMGDLLAIQNYKWGNLDGISQYYTVAGIEREESWRAINPEKAFDTLMIEDINEENKYVPVIVPNDGKSMKHGKWIWYRDGSDIVIKIEKYFLNKIELPKEERIVKKDTVSTQPIKKVVPKEVEIYEKKNSGKKSVKTRDGSVGG